MRDDEREDARETAGGGADDIVSGEINFGDYSVLAPGVHVVLDGRPITHPGD